MPSGAVIMDSGGVLLRPTTGRCFPPPAFEQTLAERSVSWDAARLDLAVTVGGRFLDEVHPVPLADEAAERLVWLRYHQLVLEALGIDGDVGGLAEAITARWEAELCLEPYEWTVPVLRELHEEQVPVVVLSDAWPSLRRWYRELGLDRYVQAMVISGEEGITKPDPRVFHRALSLLEREACDVIFVDDWPEHVRAACQLGMRGLRLREVSEAPDESVEEITDLRGLLACL